MSFSFWCSANGARSAYLFGEPENNPFPLLCSCCSFLSVICCILFIVDCFDMPLSVCYQLVNLNILSVSFPSFRYEKCMNTLYNKNDPRTWHHHYVIFLLFYILILLFTLHILTYWFLLIKKTTNTFRTLHMRPMW